MQNQYPQSTGGHNDRYDRLIQHLEAEYPPIALPEEQRQIDYLVERGFNWDEAVRLLGLREHLYDNVEMHERMENDNHMHFARWLYENGEISE